MGVYATRDELRQDRARWKRKNRVKQLKRSIEKYKYGTHLRGSVLAAYRHLQTLVEPRMNAPISEWVAFIKELQRTQQCLNYGMNYAAVCLAEIAKRAERKKQA